MASLPLELVEQICSLLCFHCQHPETFPDAGTDDYRLSKRALSRLCRVSRRICAVTQPFLFHDYATGGLPEGHNCGIGTQSSHRSQGEAHDDRLSLFLRSIIQRPDLASHTRTLQLVENDVISGCTPDLAPLLIKATEDAGALRHAPSRGYLQTKIWSGFSGQPEKLLRIQRRKIHHWLEELAIILSPNVAMLLMARDSFVDYEHIRDSRASFPALRAIALRGVRKNHHIYEASALFNAAPNLEDLYSMQCSLFDGQSPWTLVKPWTLKLANLRRLSLGEIGFEDLSLLVRCCPKLEELAVTAKAIYGNSGIEYWDMSKLLQTLDPIRQNLRKLRLSCVSRRPPREDSWPLAAGGIAWSFRTFEHLEELGFDQAAIDAGPRAAPLEDGMGPYNEWSLAEVLPVSIRRFEILHADQGCMEYLRRFAEESSFASPNLKVIRVEFDKPAGKGDMELNYIDSLISRFESMGIEMTWDNTSCLEEDVLIMGAGGPSRIRVDS
ncbi:hypothetical protein BDP55DRAFT_636491 [Colletotrichum godetiae]|uniref:F-box domain-containing protein n=1 Tax=Colletotrichum godetiae TaxID=1209918 RepID=A0AAJ0AFJ1_9PEZI|nr:uncharacterized protein BDP55DRAFT_636491 [Colletotrichum godetiae]KAK1660010.1 hypothetical protein BDP55DRAFT_636491 [Colletotrichum godetiae]